MRRTLGRAPVVIAGADRPTAGTIPPCVACGCSTVLRVPALVGAEGDGYAIVVCHDAAECAKRYRKGTSPASYAATLRGEILAVAP